LLPPVVVKRCATSVADTLAKRSWAADGTAMDAKSGSDRPLLTVTIETNGVVPAETAGTLIEEVSRGFERHARKRGRRDLRLGLRRVDIGSLIIVFSSIGTSSRAPEPDALAGSFVTATEERLLVAQGLAPGSVRGVEVRLIDALCGPVASGLADRLVLAAPGKGKEVAVDTSVVRLIEQARSASTMPRATPPPRLPGQRNLVSAVRELEGKPGTVLDVKGRWYVRLEGEGGVLNPLELSAGVVVEDEGTYLFDGSWEGRSYRIRAARRIG
jgi:hypothetical protein